MGQRREFDLRVLFWCLFPLLFIVIAITIYSILGFALIPIATLLAKLGMGDPRTTTGIILGMSLIASGASIAWMWKQVKLMSPKK